jgi:inorganic triphosphatase YgiF
MSTDGQTAAPETELKFQLGPGAVEALEQHPALAGSGRRSHLRSIYFDTPGHDLRNSGFSLRVREKDGTFVQTVKSRRGAGVFDRDEWEAPVGAGEPDLAALASTPAARVLNGSGDRLAALFETRVERTVHLWDQGSGIVEVAVDRGEVVAGDVHEALDEVELELKAGDPKALFDLAGELSKSARMTLSFESKSERGYRLSGHDGAAALKAERASVAAQTPTAVAFSQIARRALAQIASNAELMGSLSSPHVVHQTRVGIRRLRAALSVFRHMLVGEGREHVRAELRWLAGELDAARDIDVFAETFLPSADATPTDDEAALQRRVLEAQAEAHERAAGAVASPRFSALLLEASAWAEVGDWSRTQDSRATMLRDAPVAAFGAAMLDHLRRRVRRMGRGFMELDAEARHHLRLKAKKLRYAAEFFGEAFPAGGRRRRYHQAARALQDQLGKLNDLAVARETALNICGPRAGALAFTAGELVGARRCVEPAMLGEAFGAFEALDDATPFWRPGKGKAKRKT